MRSQVSARRGALLGMLGLAATILAVIIPATGAQADYPGASAVRAAKAAVANQAATVDQLDAAIVLLDQAVEDSEAALLVAEEDYTVKQAANIDSQRQLFAANNRADEAEASLDAARSDLAVIAMASYREGGTFGAFEAIMTSDGFETVIARTDGLSRASKEASLVIDKVRAADLVATTMREHAQEAADTAIAAEQAARDAYAAAIQAEENAKSAFNEAQATRAEAVLRLAELRRVSSQLEGERQAGLAAQRAARADYDAQRRAAASQGGGSSGSGNTNVPSVDGTSVGTAEQGAGAVSFALDQLGKPYVYGAAGPNSFDCSGLTMVSWRWVGVYLPRSSRAQYAYVGKIPYDALRPGDLIFWGTGTAASSVYHVTMYIGNNMIVEASRPGVPVKTRDYRNWAASNRMPWAGRP